MTKEELLQIIKLLSALESWSFSSKTQIPDYLLDRIDTMLERLEEELLK